jgi:hypothetical protein
MPANACSVFFIIGNSNLNLLAIDIDMRKKFRLFMLKFEI